MDLDKEAKTHPAYGHAVFSRVQGQIKLFASPLAYHNEFITLTISRSELRHDLSRDWRHPTKELIEVAFSPAQFAQVAFQGIQNILYQGIDKGSADTLALLT